MLVEPAPEGDERDVLLTVVQPEKVPAAVGAGTDGEDDEPAEVPASETPEEPPEA